MVDDGLRRTPWGFFGRPSSVKGRRSFPLTSLVVFPSCWSKFDGRYDLDIFSVSETAVFFLLVFSLSPVVEGLFDFRVGRGGHCESVSGSFFGYVFPSRFFFPGRGGGLFSILKFISLASPLKQRAFSVYRFAFYTFGVTLPGPESGACRSSLADPWCVPGPRFFYSPGLLPALPGPYGIPSRLYLSLLCHAGDFCVFFNPSSPPPCSFIATTFRCNLHCFQATFFTSRYFASSRYVGVRPGP